MKKTLLRLSGIVAALIMGMLSLSAQSEQEPPLLPIDPAVRMGTLPNGLTYIIRHNEKPKDRAHFYIAQRVGSMQEEDHQSGLAHFLEHMAFNGTKNFPGKNLINYLEKNGVKFGSNLNAYTSFDETIYQIMDAPATREGFVDSCLLILHDWSNSLLLTDEEIDNERGVIQEEWRSRENGALRAFTQILKEAFPKDHHYGKRMPIGSMDVVMNFPYQALRDYYHKWYRPDLQGIIVVGDIDVDRTEAKIKELFSDITVDKDAAERVYFDVPDHSEPISIVATDPEVTMTSMSIMMSSDAMDRRTKGTIMAPMMNYLKSVISRIMGERFAEILQKPDAPFRGASLSYGEYMVATTEDALNLEVSAYEGEYLKALNAAVAELKRAWEYGFTQSEYERARTEILTSYDDMLKSKDNRTNAQYADEYAHYFTMGGYIPGIDTEVAIMNQLAPNITVEMVNKTLKDMISASYPSMNNFTMYLMAPEKEGLKYPTSAELLEQFKQAMEQEVTPYEEEASDEQLMDEIPTGGMIASEQEDQAFGSTLWTLTNGIRVFALPTDYSKNEISVYGTSPGGTSLLDITKDNISARALNYATVGGISKFSPIALGKALTGKVASASTSISEFSENVNGSSSIKDLETLFQLIYLNMTDIRQDDELFTAAIQRANAGIESAMSHPLYSVSVDSIPHLLYPNNPLRRSLTIEENNKIDYKHVLDLYRERFADAGEFTFFIVGDFQLDSIKPLVATYLGALPNTGRNEKADYSKAHKINDQNKTTHFDLPMSNPMALVIDVFAWNDTYALRNRLKTNILSAILDQQYTKTIREEEGGTYGVSTEASIKRNPNGEGSLLIAFQSDPKNADRLNARVKKELNDMATNGISEEFFNKTILNMEKNFQEQQRKNSYWMSLLVNKYIWNEDEHDEFLDVLHSIQPADIQVMLQEVLKNSNYLELIASGVEKK